MIDQEGKSTLAQARKHQVNQMAIDGHMTNAQAAGALLSIIGRSLWHKNVATTDIYARLDLNQVKASINTAAAIMAAAAGRKALPAPAKGDGKARNPKRVKSKATPVEIASQVS